MIKRNVVRFLKWILLLIEGPQPADAGLLEIQKKMPPGSAMSFSYGSEDGYYGVRPHFYHHPNGKCIQAYTKEIEAFIESGALQ